MTMLLKEALMQLGEHDCLKASCDMPYSMTTTGWHFCAPQTQLSGVLQYQPSLESRLHRKHISKRHFFFVMVFYRILGFCKLIFQRC